MKIMFVLLMHMAFIYANNQLSIGFAAINPPREIDFKKSKIGTGDFETRYIGIKIKKLYLVNNKRKNSEILDILDDFSISLYDALVQSGPVLSTKEKQEAKFLDLRYKNTALRPDNIKEVWIFHKDRKEYGVKFLSKLSKKQKLDVIIYQKVSPKKWIKLGRGLLNKTSSIKPTIAIFNSFSQAQAYTYPYITAKNFVDEEYEIINEAVERKSIEALKRAFIVGVAGSSNKTKGKVDKNKNKKSSKKQKDSFKSNAGW